MPSVAHVLLAAVLAVLLGPLDPARAVDVAAVERVAREAGLAEHAALLGAAARDGVRLRRTVVRGPTPRAGTTRLGGPPDLPADTPWPRCRERPMAFLGQVRAEELPPGPGLPPTGLLSFFTQVAEDPAAPGAYLWAGDCSAIVHSPPDRTLGRRPAPRQRPRLVLRPATVTLRSEAVLPAADDSGVPAPPLEQLRLGPLDATRYAGVRTALARSDRPRHRLLGYPDPEGEDPRAQCASSGAGTAADWRLVLQLDADRRLGFTVAGGGRLWILARDGAGVGRLCSVFDVGG